MSAITVTPPFPVFSDITGTPLQSGFVYVGTSGTNAEANPIPIFWDSALTIPALQPLRTINGYISRNGSPAEVYADTVDYSLLVKSKTGALIWSSLRSSGISPDASGVVYTPSGAGAVVSNVQTKLRAIVTRSEYTSDANFNAAKSGKPNIDGAGNFDAPVTPSGEASQIQLASALLPVAGGSRDAVVYNNATSVKVFRNHAVMGGFRFRGQYSKGRAPVFPMPASKIASVSTGLGAEAAVRGENWYAVFACANNGDAAATLKVMPFLRAGTVSGSNVPLIKAGEGIHALTAQTYAWSAANNLAGTDCLVISEGGNFSGRLTTITANSSSQITLASVGSVAAYDFLLPAPPNFTNYVYLGSFYFDTAEVRNIYDSGSLVKAKMVFLQQPAAALTGAVAGPPGVSFDCAGYICPLATSVTFDSSCSLSTATSGGFAEYFDPDGGNHIVDSRYEVKATATTETVVFSNIQVPFLYHQKFWYYNGGTAGIPANRISGQFNITGWIEP